MPRSSFLPALSATLVHSDWTKMSFATRLQQCSAQWGSSLSKGLLQYK